MLGRARTWSACSCVRRTAWMSGRRWPRSLRPAASARGPTPQSTRSGPSPASSSSALPELPLAKLWTMTGFMRSLSGLAAFVHPCPFTTSRLAVPPNATINPTPALHRRRAAARAAIVPCEREIGAEAPPMLRRLRVQSVQGPARLSRAAPPAEPSSAAHHLAPVARDQAQPDRRRRPRHPGADRLRHVDLLGQLVVVRQHRLPLRARHPLPDRGAL